jgi:hypothetical protein
MEKHHIVITILWNTTPYNLSQTTRVLISIFLRNLDLLKWKDILKEIRLSILYNFFFPFPYLIVIAARLLQIQICCITETELSLYRVRIHFCMNFI